MDHRADEGLTAAGVGLDRPRIANGRTAFGFVERRQAHPGVGGGGGGGDGRDRGEHRHGDQHDEGSSGHHIACDGTGAATQSGDFGGNRRPVQHVEGAGERRGDLLAFDS